MNECGYLLLLELVLCFTKIRSKSIGNGKHEKKNVQMGLIVSRV